MHGVNLLAAKFNRLVLALVALAVGGVACLLRVQEAIHEADRSHAEAARLVQVTTHKVPFLRDPKSEEALRHTIDSLLEDERFAYVGLFDGEGQLLLEKGRLPILGMPGFQAPNGSAQVLSEFTNSIDGQQYRERIVPLMNDARSEQAGVPARGYVRLATDASTQAASRLKHWLVLGLFCLALMLVLMLLFIKFSRRLLRPLDRIAQAIEAVAHGQIELLPEETEGSGLHRFVQGFNAMAARLKESRREVVNFQLTLEEKVRARTQELLQSRDKAERNANAHKARSAYLASVNLEIRTPVDNLKNPIETLLQSELSLRQRAAVETLARASHELQELVEDCSEHALGTPDSTMLDCLDFDPRDIIAELCEATARRARAHHVELIVHLEDKVPHALRGDPDRLYQALLGLVRHAARRHPGSDLVLRVRALDRDNLSVLLDFEIGPTARKPLVDTERSLRSQNLGVYQQLVVQLGGSLESRRGEDGAELISFSCRFEVREIPISAQAHRRDQLKGLRILVVDDKDASREMLQAQLQDWGMYPVLARDGQEALALLQRETLPLPLALANMIMPGMDGIEFARKLAERQSQTRLILLVASHHHINTRKARLLGIRATLGRPLHAAKLQEALCRVMEEHETEPPGNPGDGSLQEMPQFDARVLVAEDNPVNQAVAESMLENLGCRILLANNGCEAVEMATQTSCDLILMDIQMPEMDGIEAMKRIRAVETAGKPPKHTPMVAVTAHAVPGDRENYLALGMDDYLSKPFDQDQLAALLSRWLVPRGHLARRVREGATPPVSGPIDFNVLAKLRAMETVQSPNIVVKLIEMFEEDSPRIVHELHDAVAHGDADRARRALHTLKSSSANLGARHLSELSTRMELMARENELDTLAETLVDLHCEYERVRLALAQEKK